MNEGDEDAKKKLEEQLKGAEEELKQKTQELKTWEKTKTLPLSRELAKLAEEKKTINADLAAQKRLVRDLQTAKVSVLLVIDFGSRSI